jgi:FMN-dependent NADH-azoreductase
MWNFSIPYALKYYIDCLLQPGYTFGYDAHGAFGMVTGRRLVVVTSRGSDYSAGPMLAYDFLEPYLRTVFGMIGFQEMDFINAQPMDIDRDRRQSALLEAAQAARELATEIGESLEAAA